MGRPVEKCGICDFIPLDHVFPENYPADWKFCCSCLAWAHFLTDSNVTTKEEKDVMIKNSKTIRKIHNKITMIK